MSSYGKQKILPHLPESPPEEIRAKFEAGELYDLNLNSTARIVANEGGVRSGKTYAIAQAIITDFRRDPGPLKIEIVRGSMPALKATAMDDFFGIMNELRIYDVGHHNKTDHVYREGQNSIGFFPIDDQQKLRGRKRDILWINEANEIEYDEFKQLAFRTSRKIYLDFNPVDEDHWIAEKVLGRDDVEYIHSDYTCNPFLDPEIVREIERLQDGDPNYWKVFGLGLRPASGSRIYTHYKLVDSLPQNADESIYGIDFGFNVASAVIKAARKENAWTWDELLYRTNLTNRELIEELKRLEREGEITKSMQGYADAAEPDRIQEINEAGFNVKPADKAVKPGIDYIKARPLAFTKRSLNLQEEGKKYLWKTTKDGKVLDEPVKQKDHGLDAGRYAEFTHGKELMEGGPNIRILGA